MLITRLTVNAEFLNKHVQGCLRRFPDAAIHSLLHIEHDAGIVTHRADLNTQKRNVASNMTQETSSRGMRRKDRIGQDRTGQDRTGQDRTGQDRTGQDRTGQGRALQDRAEKDRTGQGRTGHDTT